MLCVGIPIIIIIVIIIINIYICQEIGVKLDYEHCYYEVSRWDETSREGKVTKFWNQQVQTDPTNYNNKLEIIINGNEKGTCVLKNVAISGDRNVIKNVVEMILKRRYFIIEI